MLAEALHYFPMWRTWFGLNGLCKVIWNDVEPEDNALTSEPAKVPEHVENYVEFFAGVMLVHRVNQFDAAVTRPGFLGMARHRRLFFTVADGLYLVCRSTLQ